MENVSLLLFYFMYQRMRCSIRRRAINRRKRRMFLILHRIKQNLLFLQSIQTATLTLLVAAARVVHPRLEREYWALPRPRLGWFELILQDDRQSRYWEEHFRIHKDAFLLVNLIAPEISKRDTVFRDGNCFVAFGRRWKFSGHRYPLRCRKVNVRYNNERILPSTESADNEISLRSS